MFRKLKIITILLILTLSLSAQSAFAASNVYSAGEYGNSGGDTLSTVTDNSAMDRVYLFSLKDSPNSEMLLVESNGHYGLIDASYLAASSFPG